LGHRSAAVPFVACSVLDAPILVRRDHHSGLRDLRFSTAPRYLGCPVCAGSLRYCLPTVSLFCIWHVLCAPAAACLACLLACAAAADMRLCIRSGGGMFWDVSGGTWRRVDGFLRATGGGGFAGYLVLPALDHATPRYALSLRVDRWWHAYAAVLCTDALLCRHFSFYPPALPLSASPYLFMLQRHYFPERARRFCWPLPGHCWR